MPIAFVDELPPTADVVIVGGGVIGAATAFHAARAGLRPLILERRPALATLTTAAAAGGFRLQLDNEDEYRLIRGSVDQFLAFEELTGQREHDPLVRQAGYLWVTTSEERAAEQADLVKAQRSWGLDDVELLTGTEARARFPYLGEEVVSARFRQGDGLLDPRELALGLVAGSGAPVVTSSEVTAIRMEGDMATGVETTAGPISAGAVVVAAGPFSAPLLETAGVRIPVETVARQKVVVPEAPGVPPDAPMTVDEDSGAHWRPALSGAALLFTDPATPPTGPADPVPIEPGFAFRLLDPSSPVSVARVAPFWRDAWEGGGPPFMLQAGQYVMTPDRKPLIGPTGLEGLHVHTGYSGHGVMGSPAGARILADLLVGAADPAENLFRPDRAMEPRPHLDPL